MPPRTKLRSIELHNQPIGASLGKFAEVTVGCEASRAAPKAKLHKLPSLARSSFLIQITLSAEGVPAKTTISSFTGSLSKLFSNQVSCQFGNDLYAARATSPSNETCTSPMEDIIHDTPSHISTYRGRQTKLSLGYTYACTTNKRLPVMHCPLQSSASSPFSPVACLSAASKSPSTSISFKLCLYQTAPFSAPPVTPCKRTRDSAPVLKPPSRPQFFVPFFIQLTTTTTITILVFTNQIYQPNLPVQTNLSYQN